ncbi:MAG: BNR-4 repeat-containing protein, partial [Opitutaceae bacterium]|nr:BNR-4 repeat-containing protein [Opitutaceae bacterium]
RRSVALAVDGAGVLHVAWDHHGNALNYARATAPESLELGPRESMTGRLETKVTYPAFLRLPEGDLLFAYRDGASGRGNLVLNRYATATRTWSQVHASLIDGEGERSAYPAFHVDRRGTVHLAWVWRETPDVATNHDIAYARSPDGGATWTGADGRALTVPITQAGADYAIRLGQQRSLMNPPSITADDKGRPLVANYWTPEGSDIPQFHVVRFDGSAWRVSQVTRRTTPFHLAGTNTKRPPLSRAVLVTETAWRRPTTAHLVYRDDERGGRAVIATCPDIEAATPAWSATDLTTDSLGAWEPSYDAEQWRRMRQLHLLAQEVTQHDGVDTAAAAVEPTPVATLIWSPFLAGLADNRAAHGSAPLPVQAAGQLERPLEPATILALAERATDWQLAQDYRRDPRGWEIAPFYIGALEIAKLSASPRFQDELLRRFEAMAWKPAPRDYHADDYCVTQAYAEMHRRHGDAKMLAPSLALFERLLAKPATTPLDWGQPGALDRWSWCDALFMAPASWLDAYAVTGDRRHLDFMNREWWLTTDTLFNAADGFYARDESFLDLREPNGRRLYWSRGNGWVAAGLARTLDRLPREHGDYPRYLALYRRMMDAVLAAQQSDGLWRPGLLDPAAHPARETSGSSFYTFALAWGVNRGLLDRAAVEPAVRRAWNALTACVREDGKLEHVQPIGAAPEGFDPTHTDAFGVGAFLLAGAEVHRLASGGSR